MKSWQSHLVKLLFCLWGLQILWLAWHFAPEAGDLGKRLVGGSWGEALRQEDPFYRWVAHLKEVIPPRAAYVFLDRYEAGKEIEARYYLYPRRHVLLFPQAPPAFLYYDLRRYQARYLVVHNTHEPPALKTALSSPAFQAVHLSGPGLVFKADPARLSGDFYD